VSITTVVIYILLIGFLLVQRMKPRPVGTPKKLFLLPVVLTVIGISDLSHAHLDSTDVAVTVVAAIVSLAGGLVRGSLDKFVTQNGYLSVRWGAAAAIAFVVTLAARVLIDVIGVAAGGTSTGSTQSLLFTFGLTLLAEAAVIQLRALSSGVPIAPAEINGNRSDRRSRRHSRTW
jgi:hypothetical protein